VLGGEEVDGTGGEGADGGEDVAQDGAKGWGEGPRLFSSVVLGEWMDEGKNDCAHLPRAVPVQSDGDGAEPGSNEGADGGV